MIESDASEVARRIDAALATGSVEYNAHATLVSMVDDGVTFADVNCALARRSVVENVGRTKWRIRGVLGDTESEYVVIVDVSHADRIVVVTTHMPARGAE